MLASEPLILLVEDNPSDEALALRGLRRSEVRFAVQVARDGVEAIEFLFDASNRSPAFVLLDLKLPRMNGMEVLQRMRSEARTKWLPVVCFTSSGEQSDIMGCFENGANSYVRKVVDFEAYMDLLKKIAEYWLAINEPCREA